jgi:hypothetical protein
MTRKRAWVGIFLLLVVACGAEEGDSATATPGSDAAEAARIPTDDETGADSSSQALSQAAETVANKWDLWLDGPRLRGADMHPCRIFEEVTCVQPITFEDIHDLREQGANLINASYPGIFTEQPPYQIEPANLAVLDELVAWAEEIGIFVVIHYRTGPGRNEAAIHQQDGALSDVWTDQTAHDAWLEMWQETAERYRDSPVVAGYNLMVEPNSNVLVDPDFDMEPEEVQAELEGTLMDWNTFAAEMTAAVRQVDPDTPIIVGALNWSDTAWFTVLRPTGDSRTIYSSHVYNPDVYVVQEAGDIAITYPDVVRDYGETINFDRSWLEQDLLPVVEFGLTYDVPIYIGEFGAVRWVPGVLAYLRDRTGLFEEYGWNYAFYVWRGDETSFDGFNMELGVIPETHEPSDDSPLMALFRDRWIQNVYVPGLSASGLREISSPERAAD